MSPVSSQPERLMRQALELAQRGRGRVEPNPMVGCILLQGQRIIAQGYHARFGGPHAEAAALLACKETTAGATAIVTLEPCCHLNKKTPPCAPALIRAGISEVVIGTADPNPQVSGGGIAQLRAAGIRVRVGILEAPCRQLIAPWLATIQLGRPYVTLKWAQSADGLVAGRRGRRIQISGPAASQAVHQLRAQCDAILVGINTVLADDPFLTARGLAECRPLLRIVLDRDLRLPPGSRLVQTACQSRVQAYCSDAAAASPRAQVLRSAGAEIIALPLARDGQLDLHALLASLGRQHITHLLVEAGPMLAAAFTASNLADRLWLIHAPAVIGEPESPCAIHAPWKATSQRRLGVDLLTEHLNPASPAYFAPEPSADLPAES